MLGRTRGSGAFTPKRWKRRSIGAVVVALLVASLAVVVHAPWRTTSRAAQAALTRPELVLQNGHDWSPESIAFDPGGRLLASAAKDGLRVWDESSGRVLAWFPGTDPDGFAYPVAFSGDGRRFIWGLTLYDVTSGRQLRRLPGSPAENPSGIAASADGRWLAEWAPSPSADSLDNVVVVWDLRSPTFATTTIRLTSSGDEPLAFSSDGRRLYIGPTIWDIDRGRVAGTLRFGTGEVIQYSPDLRYAVTMIGRDNLRLVGRQRVRVELRRIADGAVLRSWDGIDEAATVRFSPDSRRLAIFGVDARLTLADVTNADRDRVPAAVRQTNALAFSPNAERFAVDNDFEGGLAEIDGSGDRRVRTFSKSEPAPQTVAVSPNGRWLLTGWLTVPAMVWDLATGQPAFRPKTSCAIAAFSADSRRLACADVDSVEVWDAAAAVPLRSVSLSDPGGGIAFRSPKQLLFSRDDKQVFVAYEHLPGDVDADPTSGALVIDVSSGAVTNVGDRVEADAAATTVDGGAAVLWVGEDHVVRRYDFRSGAVTALRRIAEHWHNLLRGKAHDDDVRIIPAGPRIVVNHDFFTTSVYDLGRGGAPRRFASPGDLIGVANDGRTLIFSGQNRTVFVDPSSARVVRQVPVGLRAGEYALDPGRRILIRADGFTSLFDILDADRGATLGALLLRNTSPNDWLVIAPSGDFDGSRGGWDAVLWRFGTIFDVLPPEAFFNEFYDPGLLADLFARRPLPNRQIAALDRRLPDVAIAAADPIDPRRPVSQRMLRVNVTVTEAPSDAQHPRGAGVRDVRLLRNGSLVKLWPGDVLHGAESTTLVTTIPIVAGRNVLSAYGFNGDDVRSADAATTVVGDRSLARTGTAYVLAIGLDRYDNPGFSLRYADADAAAFRDEVRLQEARLKRFATVRTIALVDRAATKAAILGALHRIAARAQPEDAVFIYFGGHGDARGDRFYMLPYDLGYRGRANAVGPAGMQQIRDHAISDLELADALVPMDAGEILLVVDACFSGEMLGDAKRIGPMNSRGLAQLAYDKGIAVLAAAQGDQAAHEASQYGHGLLTYALVEEGLREHRALPAGAGSMLYMRQWLEFAQTRVPVLQQALADDDVRAGEPAADERLQRPRVFEPRTGNDADFAVARFR